MPIIVNVAGQVGQIKLWPRIIFFNIRDLRKQTPRMDVTYDFFDMGKIRQMSQLSNTIDTTLKETNDLSFCF